MQSCSLVLFQSRHRGDPAAGSAARNAWWLPLVTNKGQSIDGEAPLVCSCSTGGPIRVCPTFLGGRLACMQHMETDLLECETVPCAFLPQVFYSFDWHARRKQRIIEKKKTYLFSCASFPYQGFAFKVEQPVRVIVSVCFLKFNNEFSGKRLKKYFCVLKLISTLDSGYFFVSSLR